MTTLSILNGKGDTKLTWDRSDSAQCAFARETVAALKAKGYTFFLVDGNPADEVGAGGGTLLVRKLGIDDVVDPDIATCLPEGNPGEIEAIEEPKPTPKRRGRPPKVRSEGDKQIVAVRPIAGG